MTARKAKRPAGPPPLELLYSRCIDEGECKLWQGYTNQKNGPKIQYNGKWYQVRRVVAEHHGRTIVADRAAFARCGNVACVANGCTVLLRRSEWIQESAKRSAANPAAQAARAAARRSRAKIGHEGAEEIRGSEASAVELAKKFGVCVDSIRAVRRGQIWKSRQLPGASIFNWRPS